MPIPPMTYQQAIGLAETQDPRTHLRYPNSGMQPYYVWLIETLQRLAEASLGDFRVVADEATPTTVGVSPGRASIGGIVLVYAGGTLELAAYNNATALIWLEEYAGSPGLGVADFSAGWPGSAHIKLAEVTLESGQITLILDRRAETLLKA